MKLPDGSPLARTIAKADGRGASTYDDLSPFQKAKMDMMANAVMQFMIPTDEQIEAFARIIEPGSFSLIDQPSADSPFMRTVSEAKARLARMKARAIVECMWLGLTPEQLAIQQLGADENERMINPHPITTPTYTIAVRGVSEDEV